jgi:hypothetical protein
MSAKRQSADESFGRLLSWIVGKRRVEESESPTSDAVGELLSWVTGKKKK